MCRTKGAEDYQVRDTDTLDGAPGDGPLDRGVLTRTGGRRGSDASPATAAVLDQFSAGFGLLGLLEYDPGEVYARTDA